MYSNRQILAERYTRSFLQRIFHSIEQTLLFQKLKQYSNYHYSYTTESFIRSLVDKWLQFNQDDVVYEITDRVDKFIRMRYRRKRRNYQTKSFTIVLNLLQTLFKHIYTSLRRILLLLLNKFI